MWIYAWEKLIWADGRRMVYMYVHIQVASEPIRTSLQPGMWSNDLVARRGILLRCCKQSGPDWLAVSLLSNTASVLCVTQHVIILAGYNTKNILWKL